MFELFEAAQIPTSCTINAMMGTERRLVVDYAVKKGYEIVAHNYEQTELLTDFQDNEEKERSVIRATLEIYRDVVGRDAKGWLSSSLRSTPKTIDLIAEEGLTFFCDLLNDDQPYLVKTRSGKDIVSIPYTSEVNDFTVFLRQGKDVEGAFAVFKEQFDWLYEESRKSGRHMNIGLHPHVIGQPFRIRALKEFLKYLNQFKDIWFPTREELADWYLENHENHIS